MKRYETIPPLVNFVGYQLSWFAVILSAAAGRSEIGIAVVAVVVAIHLLLLVDKRRELLLIFSVAFLGSAIDSVVMFLGAFSFPHGSALFGISLWPYPLWMSALWLAFATTLNHSMRWLAGRYLLAAIFGAVGGPLSYYAGERLGAISLHQPLAYSLTLLAVAWAVAMVVILRIDRLKGV